MLCKECSCKVNQVRNDTIVCICPEGSKFKTITRFTFLGTGSSINILDRVKTCTVGIVLCICSIRNNENLRVFKQTASSPERITLISVNLIKCLTNSHTSAFKFYMNKWQTIHKDRNIIAIVVLCTFGSTNNILIDDLKKVVMNILLINKSDILCASIITL